MTLERIDKEAVAQARPMTPVGGSDSCGHDLRATTFLLAMGRTPRESREAIVAGRACIRSPLACTFQARTTKDSAASDAWSPIGSRLHAAGEVDVRASGDDVEIFRDSESVAHPAKGEPARIRDAERPLLGAPRPHRTGVFGADLCELPILIAQHEKTQGKSTRESHCSYRSRASSPAPG